MEYYAVSVPVKITQSLGTTSAVPVFARVNGSEKFLASLYPVGEGRHCLRIRNKICKSVNIKTGSRVRVDFTVRDRTAEISAPKDLMSALKAEGVVEAFKAMPPGQKSFLLRRIEQAAKPETRAKRIQEAIGEVHKRREKRSIAAAMVASNFQRSLNICISDRPLEKSPYQRQGRRGGSTDGTHSSRSCGSVGFGFCTSS